MMRVREELGLESKAKRALPLGLATGLLAGGVYLFFRKMRQETPPAPAWDAELQPRPDAGREERQSPAEVKAPIAGDAPPRERVEYTNEFGEKAVGMPGGGLDALPLTPVDESELTVRFGALIGRQVVDLLDAPAGSVEAVYYRRLRGEPEWIVTSIGVIEKRRVLVPLDGATIDEQIRLSVPNSMIDEAPDVAEAVLDEEQEHELYAHYMVRRMLPGLEGERDENGLRLRMWAPVATETNESD
jgi:hypothetical protein